jgi:multicomponent Na+:H+ antiporter subunit D
MVMAAMIEAGHEYLWLMLLFASAGVFHHAGIKIPFFAFFAHDSGLRPKEAPTNMLVAMFIASVLCIAIGSYPHLVYQLLPWENSYQPYDVTHTLTQLQLLFFSALAFVWLNRQGLYPPELKSVNIDFEWTYRKLLPALAGATRSTVSATQTAIVKHWTSLMTLLPSMDTESSATATELTRRMAYLFVIVVFIAVVVEVLSV